MACHGYTYAFKKKSSIRADWLGVLLHTEVFVEWLISPTQPRSLFYFEVLYVRTSAIDTIARSVVPRSPDDWYLVYDFGLNQFRQHY